MATRKQPKGKFTEAEINKLIKKAKEEAEKHKKTFKRGDNFQSLGDEELRRKLERVNSPFINSEGWGTASPGGTLTVGVGFFNPDPVTQGPLFVHLFVGPGTPVTDNGLFLLNVDARFPRLTEPGSSGIFLASGVGSSLNFLLKIPSNIDPSTYMGNLVLMKYNPFDPGIIFDRGTIMFRVT